MRKTKDAVEMSESERARLRTLIGRGTAPARALSRARFTPLGRGIARAVTGCGRLGPHHAILFDRLRSGWSLRRGSLSYRPTAVARPQRSLWTNSV